MSLKNLMNYVSFYLHPEKVNYAIERASTYIEHYETIVPTVLDGVMSPFYAQMGRDLHGINVSDITAYSRGEKEYPDEHTKQIIEELWKENDELQRKPIEQIEHESNKELLRRYPDMFSKHQFPPKTPVYEVYQSWKNTLGYAKFKIGIDNALSNFQRMIETQLDQINNALDTNGELEFKSPTKSIADENRLQKTKLTFDAMLDVLPAIRRDLGLSEQPEELVLPTRDELNEVFKEGLTKN